VKRMVLAVVSALAMVVALGAVSPAAAAPYTPRSGLVFNNPRGTKAHQLGIITTIDRSIDAAPRGSTIWMAQYLFDIDSTANKLVAAYRRGVQVRVLIDDGNQTKQSKLVSAVLGRDKRKPSYVTTCRHSCMSNAASVMHAKFYLFSKAGNASYVSMISSANPYTGNTFNSWNNNHTIVGDATIYNSLVKYFTDMIQDRNIPNYYRTTTSGKYKLYLFPRAPQRGVQTVVPLDVLNHISCAGAAKGYGSGGRTVIRVAMWGWTYGRLDLAKKLWDLHNRGCKIDVILNKGRTNTRVIAALLKRSPRYGVMRLNDAWVDKNHNDKAEVYMHHKLLAVNGKWFGHPATKVVYTGSQNYSAPATVSNNDIVLRIIDGPVYDAYNANLNYILRSGYTKKLTKVPSSTVATTSRMDTDAQRNSPAAARDTEDEFDGVTDR
jgi:hypothetical protein